MPGGKSNYAEAKTLDAWFGNTPIPSNATLHFALFSAVPSDGSIGTELTGGGYARVAVTNNPTNFPAATQDDPGSTKRNAIAVVFPAASAQWTAAGWGVFDAASGGNLIYYAAFASPQVVAIGQAARWNANELLFTED